MTRKDVEKWAINKGFSGPDRWGNYKVIENGTTTRLKFEKTSVKFEKQIINFNKRKEWLEFNRVSFK